MLAKINLVTLLAALVLFFFPWIDVQCSGRPMMSQTGIQSVTGSFSLSKEMKEMVPADEQKAKDGPSRSYLAGFAFIATIAGIALSLRSFLKNASPLSAGFCGAIALAALLIQMALTFPIEAEAKQRPENPSPADAMDAAFSAQIQVRYFPTFYFEIIALGIPTLIFANALLDRLKKRPST